MIRQVLSAQAMPLQRRNLVRLFVAASVCWAGAAEAVTIHVDYSYDATNFFGAGNPQGAAAGAQARAALNAAAAFYSNILEDTLSAVQTPPEYFLAGGTSVTWFWSLRFPRPVPNPMDSSTVVLLNPVVPADQYRIYVGARDLGASTLAVGAPGTYSWSRSGYGNATPQETSFIEQTTNQFVSAVEQRGETSGFAVWGGSLVFDLDGAGNTWHLNHTSAPAGGTSDFYSVALHELAHALGLGATPEWQNLVSGSAFHGLAAKTEYGGPVPLNAERDHWQNGIASRVLGGTANQEVLMDPSLNQGARKLLTRLDAAALIDLGWEIDLPPNMGVPGDYNGNGIVDAADYTVWRNSFGQTGAGLPADGDKNNIVNTLDYNYWKTRFGNGTGSGAFAASGSTAVPEPAGIMLLVATTMAVLACGFRCSRLIGLPIPDCLAAQGANSTRQIDSQRRA